MIYNVNYFLHELAASRYCKVNLDYSLTTYIYRMIVVPFLVIHFYY